MPCENNFDYKKHEDKRFGPSSSYRSFLTNEDPQESIKIGSAISDSPGAIAAATLSQIR